MASLCSPAVGSRIAVVSFHDRSFLLPVLIDGREPFQIAFNHGYAIARTCNVIRVNFGYYGSMS